MNPFASPLIKTSICALGALAPMAAMCGGGAMGGGYKKAHELDGSSANISITLGSSAQTGILRFGSNTMTIQGPLAASGLIGGKLNFDKSSKTFTATATYADGAVITWTGKADPKAMTASGTVTLKRANGQTDSLSFSAVTTTASAK